jgi:S1/P1 Nuclease
LPVKSILRTILAAIGLAVFQLNAFSWGSAGHMVIAAEAYRDLSPELKAQVFNVLKSHPDFAKWSHDYHPNANFDLPAYVFMRSSSWPDEIRRSGSPYDHPNWHFIDYPLRPPGFAFEPDPRPTDNVLYGVAQCEKVLSDTNSEAELRAVYLSYLIHLVGDMHQPLHCESFYGPVYPHGDKGGNDFYVKPAQRGVRLHGIWDGLLGSSANPRTQWNYAISLDSKFSRASLPELNQDTTPQSWSLESRALAIQYGYLNGQLEGSTDADAAPPLPPDYTRNAKAVAEKQGALAGYRLADEIRESLKTSAVLPLLAESTNTAAMTTLPRKIGALEASKYYDETMIVTGKVAQVSSRPNITFINLDQPGRNSPFTAVIFPDNISLFGDVQKYQAQNVEISGTITEYHGKPEIILATPDQIKVVGDQ